MPPTFPNGVTLNASLPAASGRPRCAACATCSAPQVPAGGPAGCTHVLSLPGMIHAGGRTATHPNPRVRQDLAFMQANYVDQATGKPLMYSQMCALGGTGLVAVAAPPAGAQQFWSSSQGLPLTPPLPPCCASARSFKRLCPDAYSWQFDDVRGARGGREGALEGGTCQRLSMAVASTEGRLSDFCRSQAPTLASWGPKPRTSSSCK